MDRTDIRLLWQAVDYWAEVKPEAVALVFEGAKTTWADLKEQVDRTAKTFLELGVARGDRIAMLSMGRPEFLTTFMAASKVGAIWLGMSPKFTVSTCPSIDRTTSTVLLVVELQPVESVSTTVYVPTGT